MLITGAAGFLGSHLADRFLAEGYDVVGVDNFVTGSPENLAHLEGVRRFRLIEHDISMPLVVDGELDGVLHLASPASPPDYLDLPIQTLEAGGFGARHTLALALRHRARYLLASTSEVYGDPQVHPQAEEYWGHVNPVGPRGVYDEAKRFAEAMTMAYHRAHGVDTGIARIFNTYGRRMRPDDGRVVSNFIVQGLRGEPMTVYGDGSQTRSFCYVDDCVDGIYRLFRSTRTDPVNIGNPEEVTVLDLARVVMRETGSSQAPVFLPLPADDPGVRCPDITAARRCLDWSPRIDLREGVRRTVRYFSNLAAVTDVRSRVLREAVS